MKFEELESSNSQSFLCNQCCFPCSDWQLWSLQCFKGETQGPFPSWQDPQRASHSTPILPVSRLRSDRAADSPESRVLTGPLWEHCSLDGLWRTAQETGTKGWEPRANSGAQETGTKGREPRAEEGQTQERQRRDTKEWEATREEGGKRRSVRDGALRSGSHTQRRGKLRSSGNGAPRSRKPHAEKGANSGASETAQEVPLGWWCSTWSSPRPSAACVPSGLPWCRCCASARGTPWLKEAEQRMLLPHPISGNGPAIFIFLDIARKIPVSTEISQRMK